jgi:MFS family permease
LYPILRSLSAFFKSPLARAVGLVFALDSFLFGSWVARIPYIKYHLGINDAQLGMALFALPIGSILMNPFTGRIIGRIGSARSCLWGGVGFFLSVIIPIHAPSPFILFLGLLIMGVFTALLNVAMNTCASNLERSQGIRIMSTCHGMWSLGGMAGSVFAGLLIWADVSASVHMVGVAVLLVVLLVVFYSSLRMIPEEILIGASSMARPTKALMILIGIGLTVSMAEGLAFDWSAIYLREFAQANPAVSALGFAFFSLAMTSGRFVGDSIIPRYGEKKLLILGGLLAASGLVLAVLLPYTSLVLAGFLLMGLGCSLGAPMLYSASMRLPGTSPAAGLATFATLSFLGFMIGPPIIGFIAQARGLQYGLLFVAGVLAAGAFLSRWAKL